MSGSHVAPPSHHHTNNNKNSGSGWKVAILVIVLLIAIAALCFLLWQLFGETIMGMIGGGSNKTANVAPGIFTQVGAEYSSGKNVAGNLTVDQGTQRPAEIPPEAENVVLLDISWTGTKEQTEPVYLTVSDPSFTDGDGLSVYEFDKTQAAWEQVGTYRIQNSSVTFQAEDMTSFAFQVISSTPVVPTASPIPEPTAEPAPTPEPTPEPTPAPVAVVDYGAYPTVQTGAYTIATEMEDDGVYVFALVNDLPADAAGSAGEEEGGEDSASSDGSTADSGSAEGGVDFTYVDAPADASTAAAGGDAAAPAAPAPKATVLMNLGNDTLGAVEMDLVQAENGAWCLSGPITEGMLWTAQRDAYKDERRFSLGNHDRYLNTDEGLANIILTDNHIRTRWLIQTATLADGSEISTLNYRDEDRYYVSAFGNVVETLSDGLFPAGEVPAEPNPLAAQVTYLGTAAPADQTMLRETLRFSVTTDETLAQQIVLFKLDPDVTLPASAQAVTTSSITVPVIDENSDLSMLDIRDGGSLLQLGVDYTVAAKVYNNSTVVVVISFMGKYTGQVVRTYPGTFFRTDASQTPPTPSPEPSPTPAPVTNNTGGGGGITSWVPPTTPTQNPASSTDTQTYDDPTDAA